MKEEEKKSKQFLAFYREMTEAHIFSFIAESSEFGSQKAFFSFQFFVCLIYGPHFVSLHLYG
jgi:hypothetical protein